MPPKKISGRKPGSLLRYMSEEDKEDYESAVLKFQTETKEKEKREEAAKEKEKREEAAKKIQKNIRINRTRAKRKKRKNATKKVHQKAVHKIQSTARKQLYVNKKKAAKLENDVAEFIRDVKKLNSAQKIVFRKKEFERCLRNCFRKFYNMQKSYTAPGSRFAIMQKGQMFRQLSHSPEEVSGYSSSDSQSPNSMFPENYFSPNSQSPNSMSVEHNSQRVSLPTPNLRNLENKGLNESNFKKSFPKAQVPSSRNSNLHLSAMLMNNSADSSSEDSASDFDDFIEIERLKEARIEMENMLRIEKEEARERIEMGKEDMNMNEIENRIPMIDPRAALIAHSYDCGRSRARAAPVLPQQIHPSSSLANPLKKQTRKESNNKGQGKRKKKTKKKKTKKK